MPMYYFNLRENGHLIRDWAGCELYNDQEAIAAAQAHLRRAGACFSQDSARSRSLEIWDRSGHLIATVPCNDGRRQDEQPQNEKMPGDRAAAGQGCNALEGHFAKTQDWRFGS
jgi:hypothetical protein